MSRQCRITLCYCCIHAVCNLSQMSSMTEKKSMALLDASWDVARDSRGYNCKKTLSVYYDLVHPQHYKWYYGSRMILSKVSKLFGRKQPYNWQINVCKVLLLGLDCILIAATGAGKTLPFVMPLFINKTCHKMVIIISPLNELEYDQVSQCTPLLFSCCHKLDC